MDIFYTDGVLYADDMYYVPRDPFPTLTSRQYCRWFFVCQRIDYYQHVFGLLVLLESSNNNVNKFRLKSPLVIVCQRFTSKQQF